ncbi:MAG: DUF512 domain-containing protein [Caulobacteraceae bacterium]
MKPAPFNLLLETANRDNILILTTRCSTSCIFCSHRQNPAEVEAYYVDKLTRDEINTLIEFLDGNRKIVIGESATRICEGEPFLSEGIIETLERVRAKYNTAPIQITTSGSNLDRTILSALQRIGGVELNISLNSSSIEGRKALYNNDSHSGALDAVRSMKEYGMTFSGSIVAMPHVVGWDDMESTVLFLSENGASSIRIFMPGYTRFSNSVLPPPDIREKLVQFTEKMRAALEVPIILEPPEIHSLEAVVLGTLKNSPARESGIRTGDTVLTVNGISVLSRVDAYYKLFELENPVLDILRDGNKVTKAIKKQRKASSGAVFNYDIHPGTISDIERALRRNAKRECLILTSELAFNTLSSCIQESGNFKIEPVKNGFFGGNIMCAGLLTIKDLKSHLEKRHELPEVLLLPSIIFDISGRDLLGEHFKTLEDSLGVKVEII